MLRQSKTNLKYDSQINMLRVICKNRFGGKFKSVSYQNYYCCSFIEEFSTLQILTVEVEVFLLYFNCLFDITRKGPSGPLLAPPEGLRAPELPWVNPEDRPQESRGQG